MSHRTIGLLLSFLMITGGILKAASGQSAITDANWESMGGMPGIDGTVSAMTSDGKGTFYAAGHIRNAGGIPVNNIAMWDGTSWSALGSGTNRDISDITLDKSGNLYVVGYFDTAGGIPANHIAKWDGTTWSSLGSGSAWINSDSRITSTVTTVITDASGNVYTAGDFDSAGGVAAKNIAKWDGTAWSSLGTGVNDVGSRSYVQSLAVDGAGNIYAGGDFDSIGGIAVNHIAKWDGTSWSSLSSGTDSMVLAVTVDGSGNLYAGGNFTIVDGIPMHHIAKWNGTAWSALGDGVDYLDTYNRDGYRLSVDNTGNVYMSGRLSKPGGGNHLVKWNGKTWNALGDGIKAVQFFYIDASGVVYAGAYDMISKWDGSTWSRFGCYGTNNYITDLAVDSSNNVYAGGNFTIIGNDNTAVKGIARWNGHAWNTLENSTVDGNIFSYDNGLAVDKSGIVYAAGYLNGNITIARWNGSNWSDIGSTTISYTTAPLAVDREGNLYTGGVNNIAVWDGTEWRTLGTGLRGRSQGIRITALTLDGAGNLYAAGRFDSAGTVAANNIARWDGNEWSALGSGINYLYDIPVMALAIDSKGNLYAGGYFDTAGGVAAKHIAKWDGNVWSALGSGIDNVVDLDGQTGVFALTVDKQDNLYVGGGFDTVGGIPANYIARWDGATWSALGSGVFGGNLVGMWQSCVFSLAIDQTNNLYAGGEFLSAGKKVSPYIARCNLNSTAYKQHSFIKKSPCGFTYNYRTNMIHWTTASNSPLSFRIFTLAGREVYREVIKLPAGTYSLPVKTGNLRRGVYIGQVLAGKESMRFQMVVEKH